MRPPDIEFVYLVTVDSEWPISVLADDHSPAGQP